MLRFYSAPTRRKEYLAVALNKSRYRSVKDLFKHGEYGTIREQLLPNCSTNTMLVESNTTLMLCYFKPRGHISILKKKKGNAL